MMAFASRSAGLHGPPPHTAVDAGADGPNVAEHGTNPDAGPEANADASARSDPCGVLSIDVRSDDSRWGPFSGALIDHAAAVWRRLALPDAELSLMLTNGAAMRSLNGRYRGRHRPTDVLSFPAYDFASPATPRTMPPPPALLGDVVMACDVVATDARLRRRPFGVHARHVLTHGVLHLLGYDHLTDDDAATMEALETDLLASVGIPDPHALSS